MPTIEVPVLNLSLYTVVGLEVRTYAPSIVVALGPEPTTASLSMSGHAPYAKQATTTGNIATATTDAEFQNSGDMRLILKGYAPTIPVAIDITSNTLLGSAALTGYAPSRATGLYLTGYAPAIGGTKLVQPGTRSVALQGRQPDVITTTDLNYTVIVPDGSLTTSTNQPFMPVKPATGALTLTGQQERIGSVSIAMGVGSLGLTGINAGPEEAPIILMNYWINYRLRGRQPTAVLSGTQARIGTMIENTEADTDPPVNYQIDDITGFKVPLDEEFVEDWRGYMMRKKSWSPRHPQDYVRGVDENQHGSESPEPDDEFIEDQYPDGVSSDDL